MELLINAGGRSMKVANRNVAVAVATKGYIHIRQSDRLVDGIKCDRTVVATLQPNLTSKLMVAAAAWKIADMYPDRIVVLADIENPQCWVFSSCLPAFYKMASLVGEGTEADTLALCETSAYPG